ncbi:alpha/beta-hydrolase [Cylindrobasidium torrendii FP15055 ss-10]|uniref:Alpha/beta-hydrolase n=1 Tax=Cylindrobasidium torrendii FP15055 ss-10 TaxID=1314674 RepID=A0A0D7BPW8_9AGAR|nr:alpha/beta-hydrolase [Cylindrobasidium torrendii FP15055 ss-10]
MYASEKLPNFRWIAKRVASASPYVLTEKDYASKEDVAALSEIGYYAEIASNNDIPVSFIFDNIEQLVKPTFPLEGYEQLRGSVWVAEYFGSVSHLHGYVAYRPQSKQLVVATSGTTNLTQALQDVRTYHHRHKSGEGIVHRGFWALYKGIRELAWAGIAKGFKEHPEATELVITGHSMGGAVSNLLALDAFTGKISIPDHCNLKLVIYGAPRVGDERFVQYWRRQRDECRKHRQFAEYSVKAYNDGVPSLPMRTLGFRHFAERPYYLLHGQLYSVPASECEFALFRADPPPSPDKPVDFPRGGHNYYNGRDMEQVARRLIWLDKAMGGKTDWVEKYRKYASRRLVPSIAQVKEGLPPSSSRTMQHLQEGLPKDSNEEPRALSSSTSDSALAAATSSNPNPSTPLVARALSLPPIEIVSEDVSLASSAATSLTMPSMCSTSTASTSVTVPDAPSDTSKPTVVT